MDSEKCHIIRRRDVRPSKRRRTESEGLNTSLELRITSYQSIWRRKAQLIDEVVKSAYSNTLSKFKHFFETTSQSDQADRKLPVGLLLTGYDSTSSMVLFDQIRDSINASESGLFVSVDASYGQNLKSFLANLIKTATQAPQDEPEGYGDELPGLLSKGPRMLKYDLQILYDWCRARGIQQVILAISDGDSLEGALLNDLLLLLKSWQNRLRFTLLLGIATSVDIFHDRLSYSATHLMEAHLIDVVSSNDITSQIFRTVSFDRHTGLRLGPVLSDMLLQRQRDLLHSTDAFISTLQYAYMSHFQGNALSMLLSDVVSPADLNEAHCEAIRNLPSFRRYVEELLDKGQTAQAKAVLDSNEVLFREVTTQLEASQSLISWKLGAVSLISDFCDKLQIPSALSSSSIYIKAFSGELLESRFLRELMLYIRKAPHDMLVSLAQEAEDILITMPPSTVEASPDDFRDIIEQLVEEAANSSAGGIDHKKPILAKGARGQSRTVDAFCDLLASLFDQTLEHYHNIILHEILFYDLKIPHAETFMPKARFAIERALSAPHDYLGCSCCSAGDGSLRPSNPPTAILYQLYLESGALINVHDLFQAFKAVLGDTEDDDKKVMALFYRGLAEMKSMGFVKHSRKRIDHVAKLAWNGL